jgi:L-threonylcarbamoyladenylate synthase
MRPLIRQTQIDQAVDCLKKGGLVAMPTETVYGLAGDASNGAAVRKIFSVKGRPENHPLIVHIARIEQCAHWAKDIPDYALKLAETYWPGPMTLILKKQAHVLDSVTGGQDSVGIRIPNHPVAQQLLQAFGGGLAAPSANRFGYISPTSAEHVREDLGDKVDMILDGGSCGIGIESTIIDCTGDSPKILRPGMITQEGVKYSFDTLRHSQVDLLAKVSNEYLTHNSMPRVSGALASHYAPKTTTKLLSQEEINQRRETCNIVILSTRKPTQRHVKMYDARIPHRSPSPNPDIAHWIVMPTDPHGYAHRLYEQLHFADQLQCQEIWIEDVSSAEEWNGIRDRIIKASS